MYCTNCGNKLKENTNFCTRCGERIKQNTSQNNIKAKKPELPKKEIEMIKVQQKRTSKPKENILLALMVIIIFLLCLTSIFIISLATNTNKNTARVEKPTKEVYFELDNLKFKDDVTKVLENFSKQEENNIYKPAQSSNTIYNYTSDEHELLLAINNNNELVGFKYMEKEEFYK